jgi:hypothetical protein
VTTLRQNRLAVPGSTPLSFLYSRTYPEGLNSRQDLEQIAEQFDVRYVVVNPSLVGKVPTVVPLGEFLDRLP